MNPWKSKLKTVMVCMGSRFQWAFQPRFVVLCYHSVHPTCSFRSATPELFDTHLQWLKEHCDVIPLQKLFSSRGWDKLESRPKVAITFDDGYLDNYEYALPLLMKHGLSATFFVAVGFLERDSKVLERFQFLRQTGTVETEPLSWQQAREMMEAGMELGSHTYSHPNLARLSRAAIEFELRRSKDIMQERLGERITWLAYPFGKPKRHFRKEAADVAREVGYQHAAGAVFRGVRVSDSPFSIPRFFVTTDNVKTLGEKIYGAWDLLGFWQEKSPLWAARMISPTDSIV